MEVKDRVEKKEREILGPRFAKTIRLERMTVRPSSQGRGVGSKALEHALKEADALQLPTILATSETQNVSFYERLGFDIVDEEEIPGDPDSYHNWVMVREPRPTR